MMAGLTCTASVHAVVIRERDKIPVWKSLDLIVTIVMLSCLNNCDNSPRLHTT